MNSVYVKIRKETLDVYVSILSRYSLVQIEETTKPVSYRQLC